MLKLIRNTCVLVFSWYATGFSSLAVVVFAWFVYLTWGYIPVIVTGKPFEKTSERARGTTILVGLSLFFSLVIFVFVWLRQASAT